MKWSWSPVRTAPADKDTSTWTQSSLDGVEIPQFALELFVEKFLTPKYPQIGMDSQFTLPDRIDTAIVGLHKLTVTQK